MRLHRTLLAIALSFPLAGTAVAASAVEGYKYICGSYQIVMFKTDPTVMTVNKNKVEEINFSKGIAKGYEYKAVDFREYAAVGGSSTQYRLATIMDISEMYHQLLDADGEPKQQMQYEPCQRPVEVKEPLPD